MEPRSRIDPREVLSDLFEFPSDDAARRLARLVGLEDHAHSLVRDLHLLWHPTLARDWSKKHYKAQIPLVDLLNDLVPLIVFEGDVGTGKTALAESIGHAVSKRHDYPVKLIKMSTQVRGTGYVGEMGTLLAGAFAHVESLWRRESCPILFLIDEADSLLTSRTATQHHHEDKSGVNTILQHLDGIRESGAQIVVIGITNRIGAIDPAVRRRAASVLTFSRPNRDQRRLLLERLFVDTNLNSTLLDDLVELSEPKSLSSRNEVKVAFSYSDLTLRFSGPALRDAIDKDQPLSPDRLKARLSSMSPTPPMEDRG